MADDLVAEYVPIPAVLAERVAVDRDLNIVYIDNRVLGNPLFMTWQERNKSKGFDFKLEIVEVDVLAKLRQGSLREAEQIDVDSLVRAEALDYFVQASAYGASDLHFMVWADYTEIQIEYKNGLRVLDRRTHAEGEALTRAIYQGLCKTKDSSYMPLEFQNGQIPQDVFPIETGLSGSRIIRGPCFPQANDGGFMTARLQYVPGAAKRKGDTEIRQLDLPRRPEGEFRLGKVGYTAKQLKKLSMLMDVPNGIIIVTGPTGSGKTSTLFEALQEKARTKPHRRLVTIEDPVENAMRWAVQLVVTGARSDEETGKMFAERLRVALRMAPKDLFVGEMRGPEVVIAALQAAMTGHGVWTTLHVTDPFLFVDRIEVMDQKALNRQVFCDHQTVRGVIAQRLLPELCPHCSTALTETPGVLSERLREALATWGDINDVRLVGEGCHECDFDWLSGFDV